ncbi:MAG: pilus assembly protein PilM [Oscillospiraceae bacterium]|jgi:type IV pilus assembly protein PilN
MAERKLSIEVGERLVKACVTGKKGRLPAQSFTFLAPAGAVADGQINDPEALAQALCAELEQRGIKLRKAVFSLVSGKVAAREVTLPPIKENRLKTLIENNASEYFPVDMSKYHISYTILDFVPKGDNAGYRVLVLAVPLSILEGYFKLAEAAGLQIEAIDYGGNSQFRELENKCGDEVTMCINVNCNTTSISFIKGKSLMLHRFLSIGAEELVLNYISAANMSEESYIEALEKLSSGNIEDVCQVLPEADVKESLSRLVSNIVRTAEYFNSSNWETPVEKLVLMGCCGNVAGLREELSEAVSLPTVYLDALPGFAGYGKEAAQTISAYICCLGSSIKPVDFMPRQFIKGKKKGSEKPKSIKAAVFILVLCVLVSGAMSAFSVWNYTMVKNEKQKLEQKITDLSPAEGEYLAYLDYQSGVTDLESLAALTDSPNDELLSFIGELEKKMPREIRVLSAMCTTTGVDMNVTVDSLEQAAMVIVQLRRFESLSDVVVGAIAEIEDDSGISFITFAVSCVYKDTSPAPEAQPPAAAPAESGDALEAAE